ncbi:MAG TPA: maleate cis-trans isomerase [Pyrodictiaceae archaeon]|nr:maleate cis-trans isomerase [Pyrodictiaceae archaeon]HIQ10629.1 maleate cis-trans isomerase [Pyrodictium sp.]
MVSHAWGKRIGIIIPSSNTTMETEFWRLLFNYNITVHSSRLYLESVDVASLLKMVEKVEEAAKLLATADVDVVVFGCTTGSLVGGLEYDKVIEERIRSVVHKPVVVTARAVVEAFRTLGVKRVAVGTPYIDSLNILEKRFLEANGLEVVDIKGLGIRDNRVIGRLDPGQVYRLAKSLKTSLADAIFLSCTNMPTVDVIDLLEEEFGIPVVSSNTASLWAALKCLEIRVKLDKGGVLLKEKL